MYLKRIEIAGFKSFADRTIIDFENGVTAVVGPNGSGKSNITEAIRWVLGEQSAKSLRGGKMPDIIFAGTQERKPLNIAEVMIVLDNTDYYLPLDFSEISIMRRYRRTGESEFFINKQACRLKDIQDLFMDSGLGKESFSIISQGKVEAIFNSKPEDRRGIFEEAAGVLKYKQRKKKAEQKLFETEDNLDRIKDIIHELAEQLVPLETQSKTAEKFLIIKKELTTVDVGLTVVEIEDTKNLWETKKEEFHQLEEQLKIVDQQIHKLEDYLQHTRTKRTALDKQIEIQQQQLLQIIESLKQTEGQKNVLSERSKHTLQTASEYEQSLNELTKEIANYQEELTHIQSKISLNEQQQKELKKENQTAQANVAKYSKSSKELMEELRSQYVEMMQDQANVSNDLKYLERQYQQETTKNKQSIQKHESLVNELSQALIKKEELAANNQAIEKVLKEQITRYEETKQQLELKQQALTDKQKKMYQMMNQTQQVKARQKSLQEIQENYTGFYQGIRIILKNRQQLSGIIGVVAELIKVPEKYTIAIETALGSAAQHIVVESEKDGRTAINFLKQQHGGRATFLPITTIKARQLSTSVYTKIQKQTGFIGIASELVQYEEKVAAIIKNLLGTTLFADSLENANQLAKLISYQYRIVSLEGDIMNPGGSMTGGANKRGSQGSLFNQSHELQLLNEQVIELETKQRQTEKEVQQLINEEQQLRENLEQLRLKMEEDRLKQQESMSQLSNVQLLIERLTKEKRLFEFESHEIHQFLSDYQLQKEELLKKQVFLLEEKERLDLEMNQIEQEASQMEVYKNKAQEIFNQIQSKQAVMNEQFAYLLQQKNEKQSQLTGIVEKKASLTHQLQQLNDHSVDHQTTEKDLAMQLDQLSDEREKIQTLIYEEKQTQQQLQKEINQTEANLADKNKQQQQLLSRQTQIEIQKDRTEVRLDHSLQYLQEEYNLTFDYAQSNYEPIKEKDTARNQVEELKQAIKRLGPINLESIDQYHQVNERYQFLITQRDDLFSAKDQLFGTMDEMDQEVKERFSETFKAIRMQFQSVFPNMFGGGQAELILTDPNDLLNTGIEIEAQPPGKKLQGLSLLSGGERALTAIALLFSIIHVRPVPFCVLDEVEAALDEANVARFGRYLSTFEDEMQFIVVTHRKGTMEAADVLYGVTMQESGVSNLVSVRLETIKEDEKIVKNV
ncbi:chromosome partition protein Smc [Melissococcus plutonius]|uniref:chromosome segregation protein SMC n=1 Tax=Melissococcus plutonius TaxID=33970 RepID=UPI00065E575B|nr:chromosome segregation protein SMC [Melissococcus plutonius]AIM24502.1 chromosome partition protein Smc [Melissococcus plutonius S1]KMT24549.1 chromosome partition protein Smc [Melissococcus plutonius]KMT27262.1 chromosome partition protein Smc [Melissococcus plutonius]KMT27435.1 chromosome partition protein Smc [Melissococcus plutonius]KMT29209.1 chromosome partition protein Smc [Melissococcus plutonius]